MPFIYQKICTTETFIDALGAVWLNIPSKDKAVNSCLSHMSPDVKIIFFSTMHEQKTNEESRLNGKCHNTVRIRVIRKF